MTRALRRLAQVALAAMGLVATAALSLWPWVAEPLPDGMVRFSWRARGEVVTRCRRPTAEELAGTPAHMRQETICEEGVVAPYHLRLAVNGQVLVDSTAPGSGGRGDRSMYLFRELRVATGTHRIVAELVRTDIGEDAGTTEETVSARNRRQRAIPRRLMVDTTVTIGEREVVLVTYDAERRRLTLVADQRP